LNTRKDLLVSVPPQLITAEEEEIYITAKEILFYLLTTLLADNKEFIPNYLVKQTQSSAIKTGPLDIMIQEFIITMKLM
jgi:hypothetical protein